MTIRIELINPTEHDPAELAALSQFIQGLSELRNAGQLPHTSTVVRPSAELVAGPSGEIPPVPQLPIAAPGASEASPSAQDADAPAEQQQSEQLDANGLPWDARIHSSSKALNADGTWRYKRNGDPDERAAVEAELRSRMGGAQVPPPVPAAADVPPPVPTAVAEQPAEAQAMPAEVITFITANQLAAPMVNEVIAGLGLGLTKAADLFAKPQYAGQVLSALRALVG